MEHIKKYAFRIRKIIEHGGRKSEKHLEIQHRVFEQFCEWKDDRLVVHDKDLMLCALSIAKQLGLNDFKVYLD